MNANNFTVYQFEELTPDLEGGSFGGVLGKVSNHSRARAPSSSG